jgi:hypothetical protein
VEALSLSSLLQRLQLCPAPDSAQHQQKQLRKHRLLMLLQVVLSSLLLLLPHCL